MIISGNKTNDRMNSTTKSRKNQNALRKGKLPVLWNIGSGHYQTRGDERKKFKKSISYERENCKHCWNLIEGENTWAVPLVRYMGPFLKWTREELQLMDKRTEKLMPMHKTLHPRGHFERLYAWRKQERIGLVSIEDYMDASIWGIKVQRRILQRLEKAPTTLNEQQ